MHRNKIIAVALMVIAGWITRPAPTAFGQGIPFSEPAVLPLRPASEFVPDRILPKEVRFLPDAQALESYLVAMDGAPPPWDTLAGPQGVGDEEALSKLNTKRDTVRSTRRLIKQRIAFLWSGKLYDYDEAHKGFVLSIGPETFNTAWGEVTFRAERFPPSLIALPPNDLAESLRRKVQAGETVPVRILMFGRLSSILYGFSHEHRGVGSVIPRVSLDEIQVFRLTD
jgi:hypothetical protein